MIKSNYLLCLTGLSLIFLMAGCKGNEEASVPNESNGQLENKIVELEQIIEKQQLSIEKHEEKLSEMNDSDIPNDRNINLEESISYLTNKIYVLETLIQHTTSYKTAMLNSAEIKGDTLNLNITYTNKVMDEEAPNGFRMVETGDGTKVVTISEGVPVFLLENPSTSVLATWEDIVEFRGFVQLFEKDGKIVLISESYLP
ncbi:hypothetical protein DCE79_09445 [Lysinibacillus sp. 2017]|uniref:hypothetical protein n=1 Tax=unclassified Lysinibacillus TaxID=2636778 RepID=UPI000D526C17|nr:MULTISPECIES: hypothetical protein [unclassified Lysinibacillus]AWE07590.1 hypothetical protein DCE79_09445 [Lysinibacillus sp. 2017]TGN36753.1 hypothetical protein E4L99_04150 [Lysinibacillus sp. S2017]